MATRTSWRIIVEPKHHLFEEEHHLPNFHCWDQNVNFQRCTVFPFWAKVLYIYIYNDLTTPYHTSSNAVFLGKHKLVLNPPWGPWDSELSLGGKTG